MVEQYLADSDFTLYVGDVRDVLRQLPAGSINCCVTSPPYWKQRNYGIEGQIGLEETPDEYVATMVEVFQEVKRVLADDGTVWLNLGDSYAGNATGSDTTRSMLGGGKMTQTVAGNRPDKCGDGLKQKDLVGIPWLVAFALRADGWYLRSEIIWSKPNAMPESIHDRPTCAHEKVFLLSKSSRYFYDKESVKEKAEWKRWGDQTNAKYNQTNNGKAGFIKDRSKKHIYEYINSPGDQEGLTKNLRNVWTIMTQPYPEAHFATYPEALVEPCIKAGCPEGGTVLDPFIGSGTTAFVARKHGRKCIGIELNEDYAKLIAKRTQQLSLTG